jgi:hypothetical protein
MMQVIALTSASEAAAAQAAEQLLLAAHDVQLQLTVMPYVTEAAQATSVYCGGGELWRIGHDETKPELDPLVDRWIDDSTADKMRAGVDKALREFLQKKAIAHSQGFDTLMRSDGTPESAGLARGATA